MWMHWKSILMTCHGLATCRSLMNRPPISVHVATQLFQACPAKPPLGTLASTGVARGSTERGLDGDRDEEPKIVIDDENALEARVVPLNLGAPFCSFSAGHQIRFS